MTTKLVGRDAELRVLAGLISRGSADRGSAQGAAIVLTGEPGIGKSALLAEAGAQARAAGYRVLTATGIESEAQLPFAGLHQLLRPVISGARQQLRPAHRRSSSTRRAPRHCTGTASERCRWRPRESTHPSCETSTTCAAACNWRGDSR